MRRSGSSGAVERRLWKDHPRARRTVAAAAALSAAAAACWIAFALLLAVAIARVFVDGGTLASVEALLLAMLALAFVRGALLWSSDVVGQRAAGGIQTDLRERLAAALVALGPTAVRGERIGELVYAAGEGVDALDPYVTRYVPARVLAVLVPVLVASVVAVLDPWSVLILLIAGPMLVLLLGLIGLRVRDLAERRERELAWMNAHFLDVLRGLPTLKMFGRSAEQAETIRAVSRRQGSSTMDVLRTAFQTTLVLEWGATAATALVAIETSVRLMAGGLTFERALAVLLLTPEFFLPLRRLSAEYHVGRSAAAAAERIYAVLDTPARIHVPAPGAGRPLPARLDVRFDDVVVTYDDGSRTALAGCSLQIPQGRTVALVGPTGAGKTTVANVLLRFVDPEHGRVTVGGEPLSEIDPALWRSRVAWVPQQASLFHGTRGRQPPPGPARRLGRRPRGRGDRRQRPRLRDGPARRVRDPDRRGRRPAERRGAPAPRARAGLPQGRAAPDPGRADVASRSRERVARARGGLAADAGPDGARDRTPARAGGGRGRRRHPPRGAGGRGPSPEPSDAPNGRVAPIAFEGRA